MDLFQMKRFITHNSCKLQKDKMVNEQHWMFWNSMFVFEWINDPVFADVICFILFYPYIIGGLIYIMKDKSYDRLKGGGGALSTFGLVAYIVLKYPIKYTVLMALIAVMIFLFKQVYLYGCKALKKFARFFKVILNPGEIDMILFKLPNIFKIFMAFMDLLIGLIYAFIALLYFIALGCVTIPFNIIFSL